MPKPSFAVPINPAGACLQLGGDGTIRPVGTHTDNFGTSAAPAASVVRKEAPAQPEASQQPDPAAMSSAIVVGRRAGMSMHAVAAAVAAIDGSPRGVIRAAKARVKAIRSELKHMKALQKELAELERLIAAAKQPLAAVRDIRRSAG